MVGVGEFSRGGFASLVGLTTVFPSAGVEGNVN